MLKVKITKRYKDVNGHYYKYRIKDEKGNSTEIDKQFLLAEVLGSRVQVTNYILYDDYEFLTKGEIAKKKKTQGYPTGQDEWRSKRGV